MVEVLASTDAFVAPIFARKGRYKHTVFWTNHRNQVHGKVTLSVDFFFYSGLSSRPPRARVRDRDNDKQEESYAQPNDDQTAVILETKRKVKPYYGKQTFRAPAKDCAARFCGKRRHNGAKSAATLAAQPGPRSLCRREV